MPDKVLPGLVVCLMGAIPCPSRGRTEKNFAFSFAPQVSKKPPEILFPTMS
jgi:hypothetical protein